MIETDRPAISMEASKFADMRQYKPVDSFFVQDLGNAVVNDK